MSDTVPAPVFGVSILIPAFNEEQSLPQVIRETYDFLKNRSFDGEVLVLDDKSSDRTLEVLKQLQAQYREMRFFSHPRNLGVGQALQTLGRNARKEYCFFLPADGQVKASELDKFLPHLEGADLIVGYRKIRADSPARKILSRIFNRIFAGIFKIPIHDADSVFLIRKTAWEALAPRSRGAMLLGEMLVKSRKTDYTIKEVEIGHYPRSAGSAKGLSWKMVLGALGEFYQLYRENRASDNRR